MANTATIATLWEIQRDCPRLYTEAWWALHNRHVRGVSNPSMYVHIPSTWGTWTAKLTRIRAGWMIALDDSWREVSVVVVRTTKEINAALARFQADLARDQ